MEFVYGIAGLIVGLALGLGWHRFRTRQMREAFGAACKQNEVLQRSERVLTSELQRLTSA
jgi:uncharacterized membrane-anchored protein YhcB (DUF1043 family)